MTATMRSRILASSVERGISVEIGNIWICPFRKQRFRHLGPFVGEDSRMKRCVSVVLGQIDIDKLGS